MSTIEVAIAVTNSQGACCEAMEVRESLSFYSYGGSEVRQGLCFRNHAFYGGFHGEIRIGHGILGGLRVG